MDTRRRDLWIVLALVLAILTTLAGPGPATVAQDAATPEPETDGIEPLTTAAVVPADALVYVAATLDPASDQWQRSEDLIRRAGLGDLLDQGLDEVAAETGTTERETLDVIFDGEAALVATGFDFAAEAMDTTGASTGEDAAPAGVAFVFAAGDPDAAEDLAQELTAEEAAGRGVDVQEIEEGGATITYAPGDEFEEGVAFVRLGDVLVAAATPADLAPFIEVEAGQAPALAEDEAFARVREELPNDFLAYGFSNGPAFRDAVEDLFAQMAEGQLGPTEAASLEQSLASLEAYSGFTLWADDPGFRVDAISVPVAGASLPPVPANFDATLAERVPGDTVFFVNGFDLGPTLAPSLDMIGSLVAQAAAEDPTFPLPLPPGLSDAEQAGAIYEVVGRFLAFNPRTDLVEQLVEEWGVALSIRPDDPAFVSAVLVSGVADETRLNDAITKLAVWFNLAVIGILAGEEGGEEVLLGETPVGASTEDVDGALTQVIEVPIPEEGITIRLQWGIVDGEFVFGLGEGFGEYAAGPDGSLADSERYQAVMAELPDEHFSAVYLDLGRLMELAMPLIEEELGADAAGELPDLSAIQALAAVGFERDGLVGTSTILLIAE